MEAVLVMTLMVMLLILWKKDSCGGDDDDDDDDTDEEVDGSGDGDAFWFSGGDDEEDHGGSDDSLVMMLMCLFYETDTKVRGCCWIWRNLPECQDYHSCESWLFLDSCFLIKAYLLEIWSVCAIQFSDAWRQGWEWYPKEFVAARAKKMKVCAVLLCQ